MPLARIIGPDGEPTDRLEDRLRRLGYAVERTAPGASTSSASAADLEIELESPTLTGTVEEALARAEAFSRTVPEARVLIASGVLPPPETVPAAEQKAQKPQDDPEPPKVAAAPVPAVAKTDAVRDEAAKVSTPSPQVPPAAADEKTEQHEEKKKEEANPQAAPPAASDLPPEAVISGVAASSKVLLPLVDDATQPKNKAKDSPSAISPEPDRPPQDFSLPAAGTPAHARLLNSLPHEWREPPPELPKAPRRSSAWRAWFFVVAVAGCFAALLIGAWWRVVNPPHVSLMDWLRPSSVRQEPPSGPVQIINTPNGSGVTVAAQPYAAPSAQKSPETTHPPANAKPPAVSKPPVIAKRPVIAKPRAWKVKKNPTVETIP